ncbi:MAG: polyphenol oxidase family protein, partial [Deltaproteobacteria bacterium]|nr:polyphenol oxidase family protein [Deltaproteobacteria bacterium]
SGAAEPLIQGDFPPEGDALITQEPGTIIGIRTADCVPLLAYDPQRKAVAAIHAGWKGVLVGIIEASIQAMQKDFKTDPTNLIVAVGATLCPACFEMGPEVAADFQKKFGPKLPITHGKDDRSHLDLKHACEIILTGLGIQTANIEYLPYCNKCREDLFFSFRRGDENPRPLAELAAPGAAEPLFRQLSFIGLS